MTTRMTEEELRAEDDLKVRVREWRPSADDALHVVGCIRWANYIDCTCGRWGHERLLFLTNAAESRGTKFLGDALETARNALRSAWCDVDDLLVNVHRRPGSNGEVQWSRTRRVRDNLKLALKAAEDALRVEGRS